MEIDVVEPEQIIEEVLQTFNSIQVEGQSIIEIDNQQALGIQVSESASVIQEVAKKSSTQLTRRRIKDSTLFKIVKVEKNHDCLANTMKAGQRHATSKLISGYIIDNIRDPWFEVTPAFVMAEIQKMHELDIGYHKAWRAIQHASALIRGTPEENYELLSSYLYMMKSKNPGTYTNIKTDDNNRFLYMFYAYGSSIAGWNHCRPVIAIDATFLKSKYRGVLMISVTKDANNQIFPLAFGIAESENNNSYEWHFSVLHNAIGSPIEKRNIKKSNFCSDRYLKESWLKTYERQIHPVGYTVMTPNSLRRMSG
nr:uncharacterized protein LOC104118952 [Nicotiana tomentosiformis]